TEYGYDLAGRPRCTAVRMNPDAWATPLADKCVPGPAHSIHGPDRISRSVHDAAGQLVESWDGVGTPLARREAAYGYNLAGERTGLVDARGFTAAMRYDGFGRQSRWVFPNPGSAATLNETDYEEYRYDPNGNRTWLRKRDGSVLTFDYDALDRMTRKTVPERAGLDPIHSRDVFYAYDLRGLQTKTRFDSLSGEGITNAWDGFGRLLWTNTNQGGQSRTLWFAYDADGNRTRITHPAGAAAFAYAHDGLGRMTMHHEISSAPGINDHVVRYWYKPTGERHSVVRGAGTIGFYTVHYYDSAMRPSVLANDLPVAGADMALEYGWNPAGQVASLWRSSDAYVWAGGIPGRSYAADGLNRYASVSGTAYSYDPNGNLTFDGSTSYAYDVENRLVGASGLNSAALVYDPLGRLFQTSGGAAGPTQFLYDGDALVAEHDGSGRIWIPEARSLSRACARASGRCRLAPVGPLAEPAEVAHQPTDHLPELGRKVQIAGQEPGRVLVEAFLASASRQHVDDVDALLRDLREIGRPKLAAVILVEALLGDVPPHPRGELGLLEAESLPLLLESFPEAHRIHRPIAESLPQ
ncbi:MAG TPA: hypothetical protein VEA60_14100, partial [Allosphingosinicella sp.]|nr:hypothetical protein [Allosphingosinicella sp.]